MKLSKSKIKQLIREELSNVLREQDWAHPPRKIDPGHDLPDPREQWPKPKPGDPPNINEIWRMVQELQRRVDKIDPPSNKPIHPERPGRLPNPTGASPGWPGGFDPGVA